MSHQVCHDVGDWVSGDVSQPLEKCVEQDCDWWCVCCNKWFCFIVWVVVQVVTWVVTTICELVADVVDIVVAFVKFLFNLVVGIFTLNPKRIWDAFVDLLGSVVGLVVDIFRTWTFGGLVSQFRDAINKWKLRDYVSGLIDKHAYTDDQRSQIKDALGITGTGGFGLRLTVVALRGFVRSDTVTIPGGLPDLALWNSDPNPTTRVDLKVLAGFDSTAFGERGRPEVVGDQDKGISEGDIDTYLANPTSPDTTQFRINCMTDADLNLKLSVAKSKGTELGLKLEFGQRDVELTRPDLTKPKPTAAGTAKFLTGAPFNRTTGSVDQIEATRELCSPLAVATFLFSDNGYTGFSAHLKTSTCVDDGGPFHGDDLTGAIFRDRLPDFVFKYVPIHELGHTFGLCHADGIDRIMYSAKEKSWWSLSAVPEYLLLKGEPSFTLEEGKSAWDYIIANFSPACLSTRQR